MPLKKNVETPFEAQFGIRKAKEGQDEHIRTIRSFKTPKTFMFKTPKKTLGFYGFLATEASQEILKRPKMAPKGHPKKPRPPKKWKPRLRPKIIKKIRTSFEPTLKPKQRKKKPLKPSFLGPPSPASQGSK